MTVNIVCSGPGPHIPASGILGQSDKAIAGMLCPSSACQAALVTAGAAANASTANEVVIQAQAQAALSANANDLAQDATIITQAVTVTSTSGTLTLAQLSTIVRQLAQAVSMLAANDQNTKKELNALIRLALGQFDSTS